MKATAKYQLEMNKVVEMKPGPAKEKAFNTLGIRLYRAFVKGQLTLTELERMAGHANYQRTK